MHIKNILVAGTVGLTLVAAPVAFADSREHSDNGLHLGGIIRLLDDRTHDRGDDDRKDEEQVSVHAETRVVGTVTAISGSMITIKATDGTLYSVNAANASFEESTLASIAVGDTVKVEGSLSGSLITATEIKGNVQHRVKQMQEKLSRITGGVVTAINGSLITLDRFGPKGTTTITTDASTVFSVNGQTATSGALTVGSTVFATGTTTSTTTPTFAASVIYIIRDSLLNLVHFFNR